MEPTTPRGKLLRMLRNNAVRAEKLADTAHRYEIRLRNQARATAYRNAVELVEVLWEKTDG